jgi:hypothetical protein
MTTVEIRLSLSPSRPNFPWAKAKHTFMPFPFYSTFFLYLYWYLAKLVFFRYQKIPKKFRDLFYLFMGPSHFCFYNFTEYLSRRLLLWNVNLVCNTYLSFFSKKKIYVFLLNPNFIDLFIGARVKNTIFFWLRNIYQRQSWKYL